MRGGILTREVMLELPLHVRDERARAHPEEVRPRPLVAELLLHEREPGERILR